ncbi:DUF5788 family protein [Natronobacterium gregoryi]|uniref:Uncharacterized protein n=2 Tax=Natronobacterium gregoryi TaxID=44930 RepID=L0AG21_NATGS|nr:DUF5788 family protein [Natronobacterium gregoryi]AFZ72873.1 hypothetical protein Natgr_1674 [Natronobacterium gregoryi SP2]ELY69637.1 hypothetical protein C490_07531 [Natronobacterium gregoryi SP2]PLK21899.1 hypothetical protein CYV19_02040 [Natronobacterium gregoryi SP2]SFI66146.1 hypothetical protein SAMN05443661_10340 [Natronobacterium gregoryi]
MNEDERKELLERVNRPSATIGISIPDTITIGDEEIPVDEFVIETRKVEGIPDDLKPVVREAQISLQEERERLVERLESAPLEYEEAEEIADTIVGIDRTLNALKSLRGGGYTSEAPAEEIEDHKRWLDFLNSIR